MNSSFDAGPHRGDVHDHLLAQGWSYQRVPHALSGGAWSPLDHYLSRDGRSAIHIDPDREAVLYTALHPRHIKLTHAATFAPDACLETIIAGLAEATAPSPAT